MRIGSSIGPWPEKASEVPEEFDFVELIIGEDEVEPSEIDTEQLERTLEEKGFDLVIHLGFRQPLATQVGEFNSAVIEYFERLLLELDMDVEKAVIHADSRRLDEEALRERLEMQISDLEFLEENLDVQFCFENVEHKGTPRFDELAEIVRETDSSMCFDVGHAYLNGASQDEIEGFFEENRDVISHVHVHDARKRGDSHLALGDGEIDYTFLRDADFDGTVCLELFTMNPALVEMSREVLE